MNVWIDAYTDHEPDVMIKSMKDWDYIILLKLVRHDVHSLYYITFTAIRSMCFVINRILQHTAAKGSAFTPKKSMSTDVLNESCIWNNVCLI